MVRYADSRSMSFIVLTVPPSFSAALDLAAKGLSEMFVVLWVDFPLEPPCVTSWAALASILTTFSYKSQKKRGAS